MKKGDNYSALKLVQKYFPQVQMVVDSNKPCVIEVNAEDASSRDLRNPAACSFARACKRTFTADGVIVGLTKSYIIINQKAVRFSNPETVTREIVSFDRMAGFMPGIYTLSAISPCMRLGTMHRGGGNSGTKGKRRRHVTANVRILGE